MQYFKKQAADFSNMIHSILKYCLHLFKEQKSESFKTSTNVYVLPHVIRFILGQIETLGDITNTVNIAFRECLTENFLKYLFSPNFLFISYKPS